MSNLATIVNNILADSGIDDINVVVTTGSYTNPAWIVSLPWTKITGTPTTLAGYGITDAYTQTQVNTLLNAKQNTLTLTTTGTSGVATLIGATLNIPDYGGALGAYLPLAGGTMTGNINWAQTDRGLTWVFNTDGASIKFYNTGDGDTDSRLEFATLDNNDEYFRWGHIPSGGSFYESMRLRPVSNGNAELIITGKIIKSGGTTSQFLKANGDVDSNSYYLASNPSAFITLTSLSNVAPIQYNNTTGAISITQASGSTNGFLSSTDWNTFNNKTSNVGTVTSVAALTLGTTGTDLSSSVANSTTTPVITLNVPTASAANRGALSAADWTTFNNKQNALTNPVTGTGTAGQVAYFNGTTSITSESNLFWDASNNRLGIGIDTPTQPLDVYLAGTTASGSNIRSYRTQDANNATAKGIDVYLTTNGTPENQFLYGVYVDSFITAGNNNTAYSIYTNRGNAVIGATSGNLGVGTVPSYKLDVRQITTGIIAYFGYSQTASSSNALIKLNSGRVPQSGSDYTGESGIIFGHSGGTGGVNYDGQGGYIKSIRLNTYASGAEADSALVFATTLDNVDYERMRIISNGFVGINESAPGYRLTVTDSNQYIAGFLNNVANQLTTVTVQNSALSTAGINTAAATFELVGKAGASTHGRHAWIGAEGVASETFRTKVLFKVRGESNTGYQWSGAAEAPTIMTLDGNGFVGVNTKTPGVALDVSGSGIRITNATPNIYFNNTVVQWKAYMPTGLNSFAINDAVRDVLTLGYNGAASYFQGCNLGIGTALPSYRLQVVTDAVAGRQNMSNISRTTGNWVRFTNPQFSADASMGLILRVFPDSDGRQGAGIIASGGANNACTNLDLFVTTSLDGTGGTSYSALNIDGFSGAATFSGSINTPKLFINTTLDYGSLNIVGYNNDGINIIDQRTSSGAGVLFKSGITFRDYYLGSSASIDFYHNQYYGVGVNRLGFSFLGGERMSILYNGNVGINNTSPSARLHVQIDENFAGGVNYTTPHLFVRSGASAANGNVTRFAMGVFDGAQVYLDTICTSTGGGSADLAIATRNGGAPTEKVRITSGGLVGINTTPSYRLDVYGGGSGVVLNLEGINAYNAETGILMSSGRAKISTFLNGSSGTPGTSMRFYTMPDGGSVTERMRITSNGVVGIGTDNPTSADVLQVSNIGTYSSGTNLYTYRAQDNNNTVGYALKAIATTNGSPNGQTIYGAYIDSYNAGSATNLTAYGLYVNRGRSYFSDSVSIGITSFSYKFTVNESTTNPIAYFGTAPLNASSRNALIVLQSGTIPQSGGDTTGEVGFLFKHSYGTGGVNGTANGGYIESIRESVFGVTSQVNTALVFGTSRSNVDGERMRLTSLGRLGLNQSNPTTVLHVYDDTQDRFNIRIESTVANNANKYMGIGFAGENANTKGAIFFQSIGASYSRGNMLFCLNNAQDQSNAVPSDAVLTLYTNTRNATFVGSVTATSFFESSDKRLKSNIIDLDVNVSSIIAKSYLKDGVQEIGYIAQDVENILPSAVSIRDNGYLDLSYRQIHTAKIAALEKEVAELKKQLNNK